MKCMEYSNANHINIIPQDAFEELVQEVFNVIASNITKSLGPLGSSATIFDGTIVEATKDGYHILDKYIFHNRYKKMIYNLIKTPCTKMNNTVGDGTTTAIALTNEMYQLYKAREADIKALYRLPREFTTAWNMIVDQIISKVNGMATSISSDDYDTIYKLAYISSNGNAEIADAIAKTYQECNSPMIKMKDSPTNKSYIEAIDGFEFPSNAIDVAYVRNQDLTATEKYVATMIFDHKIETDEFNAVIAPINEVLRAQGKKLIIMAPEYDSYMLESTVKMHANMEFQKYRKLNLILTQYRTGKLNPYQKEDLAVVLRSVVVNQNLAAMLTDAIQSSNVDQVVEDMESKDSPLYRCIGTANSVLLSVENGCIFKVSNLDTDETYQETLKWAQHDLQEIMDHINFEQKSYSAKIYNANARISQLLMKNYIYYIGADSELQKQILHDAVDDVIKCVRSAIKNGIVPGCQISIIKACNEIEYNGNMLIKSIIDLIRDACINTYIRVLTGPNGDGLDFLEDIAPRDIVQASIKRSEVFDLESGDFTDGIITSAETDTMVLTAASELIKILTSGNQCIFLDAEVNSSHQDAVEVYA